MLLAASLIYLLLVLLSVVEGKRVLGDVRVLVMAFTMFHGTFCVLKTLLYSSLNQYLSTMRSQTLMSGDYCCDNVFGTSLAELDLFSLIYCLHLAKSFPVHSAERQPC